MVKGVIRDIQALEVHGDFLTRRVQLATDATLGMINLVQSATVRIVSVVAVLALAGLGFGYGAGLALWAAIGGIRPMSARCQVFSACQFQGMSSSMRLIL